MIRIVIITMSASLFMIMTGCKDSSDNAPPPSPGEVTFEPTVSRDHRAITGVSMGGYGALNLGTQYPDRFRVIGSLGGPVDMRELLRHVVQDNLDVKELDSLPTGPGSDFTFDLLPDYPDRGTRMSMFQDLVIAFGNPFLHHTDPDRAYLASDSQPALIQDDDRYGPFSVPIDPRGFSDGGDSNEDGWRQTDELPNEPVDVLLVARGAPEPLSPTEPSIDNEERRLVDRDGDGVFDLGEGLVENLHEPFDDLNDNTKFEPAQGETFQDVGLDGLAGTGDFGEGNGQHDFDPDVAHWLDQDPLTRLEIRDPADILTQRIYMDAGLQDEFEFATHYQNLIEVLEAKGIPVTVETGFSGSCTDLPSPTAQFHAVFYNGGHVGIPVADEVVGDLSNGDPCSSVLIWQRVLGLLGYVEESFPNGEYGPGGLQPNGETTVTSIESPTLAAPGEAAPVRDVMLYRPPRFFNDDDDTFPIVYFLGGYGMKPADMEPVAQLLDLLILSGELQNFFFVAVPGSGGRRGSFYVDHVISSDQVPDLEPTSGRYEASLLEDLMPVIESSLCEGRVRKN